MPTPVKPTSFMDWTVANSNFGTVTSEPTAGKKQTGWTPGEPPPIQIMNWLFYNTDQWIKYFSATTDAQTASIASIIGSLFSTNLAQEVPTGTADGSNLYFTLTQAPSIPANTIVFANSLVVPSSNYTVSGRNIIFNAGFAPASGSDMFVIYVIQTGFSGQAIVGSGKVPKVETRTLTSAEVTNGQLTLIAAPFDGTQVLIDVIEDGPQAYGLDFTVSGQVINWTGLAMAPAVSAGSILRIQYFI